MGLTVDGFDSVSLSPVPNAKGVEVELGRMAATELGDVREVVVTLLSSSILATVCGWYVDGGMKGLVKEEDDAPLSLYVDAIAALAIAWRAMSSVRVEYVSGLGKSFGQSITR